MSTSSSSSPPPQPAPAAPKKRRAAAPSDAAAPAAKKPRAAPAAKRAAPPRAFEARHCDATRFSKILAACEQLVRDANLVCTHEGVSMNAMDASQVAVVELRLDARGFEAYRCERPLTLGVSVDMLLGIFKSAGAGDTLTLAAQQDGDKLDVEFSGQHGSAAYTLSLLNIDCDPFAFKGTAPVATVRVPSATFARVCRDLALVGERVDVTVHEESVVFHAKGDTSSLVRTLDAPPHDDDDAAAAADDDADDEVARAARALERSKADATRTTVTHHERTATLPLPLRFLVLFARAAPLSSHVALSIYKRDEMSLAQLDYDMGALGTLRFYLAGKIEDDDAAP